MTALEIAANAVTTLSIWLAARNSRHTWATGILGCGLFGVQFFLSKLYAEVTLQAFFLVTSAIGWWQWAHARTRAAPAERPVTRARPATLAGMVAAAAAVTLGYGALLHHYTDAYAPYVDSAVLALSVAAQFLLMQRQIETWVFWIVVNTLSVPLYASRGLELTAVLYAAYWFNAWYGLWRWRRQARASTPAAAAAA
jgi:nicotinamide mononucleotide transporter